MTQLPVRASLGGMTSSFCDCQVLVVGAGPTGLVLAAQLLARGIDTRIIDKGDGPARERRAVSVHARTLEVLDTMGLADAFIEHGHRGRRFRMYAGNRSLLNLDMTRNGSRYGFILNLAQSETERLLRSRVHELGGTIEQRSELAGLSQHGDGVAAPLRFADGRETEIRAGYVVGCDGAHSRVRHELGLPFDGQPYAGEFLLADVGLDGVGSVHPGPSQSPTRGGWRASGATCGRRRPTGAAGSCWPATQRTSTPRPAV